MSELPETPIRPPVETNGAIGDKLSSSTVTNIAIVSIGGMLSILLLLFGNFEGRVSRVLCTLLLFGLFMFCSSYHMNKSKFVAHIPVVAQLGNTYMLLLGLILIWGTLAVDKAYRDFTLLPLVFLIVGLVQLGIYLTQRVTVFVYAPQKQLRTAAYFASSGMAATSILLTLPIGAGDFTHFGEIYWKFLVAVIMFTGIMVVITSFIIWAFRSSTVGASVPKNVPMPAVQRATPSYVPRQQSYNPAPPAYGQRVAPHDQGHVAGIPFDSAPVTMEYSPAEKKEEVTPPTPVQEKPQFDSSNWPVFPNGEPLPATSEGLPDFAALQRFLTSYKLNN